MIFRVTHIDVHHHRQKAHVTASNVGDCIEQIEAELGDHIGLSVVRLRTRPVLHLRPTEAHFEKRRPHA